MYRIKSTGEYPVTRQDLIRRNPNISLPAAWDDAVLALLGVDYVTPVAKPEVTATQRLVEGAPALVGGKWMQTWTVQDMAQEEVDALLVTKKAALKTAATAKRKSVEAGGKTLPGGIILATSKDDQDRIASAILYLRDNPAATIDWKADSGWVQIGLLEIEQFKNLIGAFVQDCFSAEKAHHTAIDAITTLEAAGAYDIAAGWPS